MENFDDEKYSIKNIYSEQHNSLPEVLNKETKIRIFPFFYTFLENQKSHLTRKEYERDIVEFGKYLAIRFSEVSHPHELTRHHIIRYKLYLESKKLASATISRKLSGLAAYFKFLASEGIIEKDILYGVKWPTVVNKKQTAVLSDKEVSDLLNSIPINTIHGLFHHAILSILFGTGLRSSPVRNIRLGDFSFEQGHRIVRVVSKGNKAQIVPIHPLVWQSIDRYISALKDLGVTLLENDFIFQPPPGSVRIGEQSKAVSKVGLNKIFKQYCSQMNLKDSISMRYSPHSARGSFATNLILAGVAINDVQTELGHANIQTTTKYVKIVRCIEDRAAFKLRYFEDISKEVSPPSK